MTRFMRWWKRKEIAAAKEKKLWDSIDTLTKGFEDLTSQKTELEQQLAQTQDNLAEIDAELLVFRQKEEEDEAKRNSVEPWIEIKNDSIDPIKGIQLTLDWNDAFIQYLKDNGIKGRDDETIVQKWLAMLYEQLIDKFEENIIEENTPTHGDYE